MKTKISLKEMSIHESILLYGKPKTGKCLKDSLIQTNKGIFYFSEIHNHNNKNIIQNGDKLSMKIKSINCENVFKDAKWFSEVVDKTIKVTLKNNVEIAGTPEHKVRVFDTTKGIIWKKLSSLNKNDLLIQTMKYSLLKIKSSVSDELLSELLGYYVANGNCVKSGIIISTHNKEHHNRIKTILDELNLHSSYSFITRNNITVGIAIYSKKIKKYALECGLLAGNKKISLFIRKLSDACKLKFILAYLESDGYYADTGMIEFLTKSKQFCYEFRELLHNWGIYTSMKLKRLTTGDYAGNLYYRTQISVEGVCNLCDLLNINMIKGKKITKNKKGNYYRNYDSLTKFMRYEKIRCGATKSGFVKNERVNERYIMPHHESFESIKHRMTVGRVQFPKIDDVLNFFIDNNVYLTKIENIEVENQLTQVYDFTIDSNHTFVCNSLINHNTWAVCSIIEICLLNGGNIFYISTDNGLKRTAQEYFGDKFDEIADKINHYFLHKIDDISNITKEIKEKVTSKDLIIIDLFSHIWEMCQNKFIEVASGGNIVNFLEMASRDPKKFGAFDSSKWLYIKKIDSIFINELIITPPCKVVAICSEKSIEFDKMHHNTSVIDKYSMVNGKPAGQPELVYHFNTIIYLGETKDSKFLCVLGDRGRSNNIYKQIPFKRNFWEAYNKYKN